MNTRLQQFLSAENITQSQFADNIGVAISTAELLASPCFTSQASIS